MTQQYTPSKALNIGLWAAQILLAVSMLWGAYMKLLLPLDKLIAMWPWAGQVSPALLKLTAIIDLLGGLGLMLPMLLNIKPHLTFFAAIGVLVLMVVASMFHICRGEGGNIAPNVVFAVMAGFVAWGRR